MNALVCQANYEIILATTIGTVIDERIGEYKEVGKMSEAFALDACATGYKLPYLKLNRSL